MSCCGKQREQFYGTVQTHKAFESVESTFQQPRPIRYSMVYFEYIGKTGLTVLGPITGKHYRFDRPGARVAVDPRDRPSLAAVPRLRQVMNPTEVNWLD